MKIGEMFEKPIDRDIKGVIKVGQDDNANAYQELNEYVVTKELSRHFRDFFESYTKGINSQTDKMGVWISGFFGSGKSHFLKILSYLLENREVNGKRAIDFFIDGNKIVDPLLIAKMNLACNLSADTDVILFNIDSKGSSKASASKDAIVEVFMKVFNEMQGYCGSIPFLADFERQLSSEGMYDKFKAKFEEITGNEWEKKRQAFFFIQDNIINTITALNIMSEESARVWCKNAKSSYDLSIEKFADMVRSYCESKGKNHHIVFLVDEIGQYIAEDERLMLNLQTVTEDLGIACGGHAWIIVTSQQDIDSITKVKGNDFSKIQGRFDTRLVLSSANVDEVIRKRILEKNQIATDSLRLLYDQKEAVLKNLITFTTDTADKRLYTDREEFAAVYPFIPYQFNLLGQVLTAIRTYGASGKHLADGERSMIALFKESADTFKNSDVGVLIPFYVFYNALDKFIDSTYQVVISQATDNSRLSSFDVELLKVLFMVKYVKEIKTNVENLTTLMITNIDEDRIALKKQVEESLIRLINETFVQKNGDTYMFLSNEEQEINRRIGEESAEMAEIINETSAVIFQDVIREPKYRYVAPHNGRRYDFAYNQIVDDRFFKNIQSNDIGVKVLTPYYDTIDNNSAEAMRMLSAQENNVIVVLPNDSIFLDEITEAIKIEKFINRRGTSLSKTLDNIKRAKQDELIEKRARVKTFIEDALKNADLYVNGDKVNIGPKEPVTRIYEAMAKLVSMRFNKLAYMETAPTQTDIEAIFTTTNQTTLGGMNNQVANKLALGEVLQIIELNSVRHMKTTLKGLVEKFSTAPWGFADIDVQWLLTMLFKQNKVGFTINSQIVSLINNNIADVIRYVTKKEFAEKLLIEVKQIPEPVWVKNTKDVMKELFGIPASGDDTDAIMKAFQHYTQSKTHEIQQLLVEYRFEVRYPGKNVLRKAEKLLEETSTITNPMQFYQFVSNKRDEFLDSADDISPVIAFFANEQKTIFTKAWKYIDIFQNSKTYVVDKELIDLVGSIRAIAAKPSPYSDIYKLPALLDDFAQKYTELLKQEAKPIREELEADRTYVLQALQTKDFADKFEKQFLDRFEELRDKLAHSNKISEVKSIRYESDALKTRCLNEISDYESKMARPVPPVTPLIGGHVVAPVPVVPKKTKKLVSMKSVIISQSVELESEQDIDKLLERMKIQLMKQLDEDTIISLLV